MDLLKTPYLLSPCDALTYCVLSWQILAGQLLPLGSCGWSHPAAEGPFLAQLTEACWGSWEPWAGTLCSGYLARGYVLLAWADRGPGRAWGCWRSSPDCWSCRGRGRCSWCSPSRCSWRAEGSYLEEDDKWLKSLEHTSLRCTMSVRR